MVPPSKILIYKFPERPGFSGLDNYLIKLTAGLRRDGQTVQLITSCPFAFSEFKKLGYAVEKKKLPGESFGLVKNWHVKLFRPVMFLILFFELLKYRRQGFRKVLFTTTIEKFLLTRVARLLGLRVYWLEVFDLTGPNQLNDRRRRRYGHLSHEVKIIAVSNYLKEQLISFGVPGKNLRVIHEGVDPAAYREQVDIFSALAEKSLVAKQHKQYIVGFVGRLEEEKGLPVLLRAFSLLTSELPGCILVIVGEGSARQNLEWLIRSYNLEGRVRLVGYKEDLLRWLWGFDVFVLPSLHEALGITAIQASACGKPVIATDFGGLPEVVEHGKSGLLFAREDAKDLARAIKTLYSDRLLGLRFGDRGREIVEQRFSLLEMQNKIFEALME